MKSQNRKKAQHLHRGKVSLKSRRPPKVNRPCQIGLLRQPRQHSQLNPRFSEGSWGHLPSMKKARNKFRKNWQEKTNRIGSLQLRWSSHALTQKSCPTGCARLEKVRRLFGQESRR